MKNIITHLLAAVGAFAIAVGLMQGIVQEFISFADPINEMAMCVLMLMAGTIFTGVAVGDISTKSRPASSANSIAREVGKTPCSTLSPTSRTSLAVIN